MRQIHRVNWLYMKRTTYKTGRPAGVVVGMGLVLAFVAVARPQITNSVQKAAIVNHHASGTFEVKMNPQKPDNKEAEAANLSRMSSDKQYHGDLEGVGKGEMLTTGIDAQGSGVYVAIERVTGTLKGRSGSFVLQHSGVMTRKVPQLSITVVPDSGTGQLAGLSGKMNIIIAEGKHSYEFEYTLPEKP